MIRVAINGFGRIGRLALRALVETPQDDMHVVAINTSTPSASAYLFQYDSVHGPVAPPHVEGNTMDVGWGPITLLSQRDPEKLPWESLEIDVVLECTGQFTTRDAAAAHLHSGARKVLVSAPCKGADKTVVYGVNHQEITSAHEVVSNASCTTNALAPVLKVLQESVGLLQGHMTTIHAVTGGQRLTDSSHKDLRRGRSALCSMIPTSTGAAQAITEVLPSLQGKLSGCAFRVPILNVSLLDLTFCSARPTTKEELHKVFEEAASTTLAGTLETNAYPLVSVDFTHRAASCTVDMTQTHMVDATFGHLSAWYDNEWGFARRMLDVASFLGTL